MDLIILTGLALVLDLTLGEPPLLLHPVVWMGKVVSFFEQRGQRLKPNAQLVYGVFIVLFIMALFAVPSYFLLSWLKQLNIWVYYAAGALILKSAFSVQELEKAALRVKKPLVAGKLDLARAEVKALVKRDTTKLTAPQLTSAVVESVSENSCDSIVAPLFFFAIGGIPAALAYRVVNTMDAMIGYRGKYEYLGKFAAKMDTVLNYIPARLTAIFYVIAAFIINKDGQNAWKTALRDHRNTASPNAGWPMAACAGALRVQLEKIGHYKLGQPLKSLEIGDIDDSIKLMHASLIPCLALIFLAGVMSYAFTR